MNRRAKGTSALKGIVLTFAVIGGLLLTVSIASAESLAYRNETAPGDGTFQDGFTDRNLGEYTVFNGSADDWSFDEKIDGASAYVSDGFDGPGQPNTVLLEPSTHCFAGDRSLSVDFQSDTSKVAHNAMILFGNATRTWDVKLLLKGDYMILRNTQGDIVAREEFPVDDSAQHHMAVKIDRIYSTNSSINSTTQTSFEVILDGQTRLTHTTNQTVPPGLAGFGIEHADSIATWFDNFQIEAEGTSEVACDSFWTSPVSLVEDDARIRNPQLVFPEDRTPRFYYDNADGDIDPPADVFVHPFDPVNRTAGNRSLALDIPFDNAAEPHILSHSNGTWYMGIGRAQASTSYLSQSNDSGWTWSEPEKLPGDGGSNHKHITLLEDPDGRLGRIWRCYCDDDQIYSQWSSDGGETWGPKTQITDGDGHGHSRAFLDDSKTIHLTYREQGKGPLFYRNSSDLGDTWTQPVVVDDQHLVGDPTIVRGPEGSLFLAYVGWHQGEDGDILLSVSKDNGKTWSQPIALANTDWQERGPEFSLDPSGKIHLVYEAENPNSTEWEIRHKVQRIDRAFPNTTAHLSGTKGTDDWYMSSDVNVTLNATDPSPGSGVLATEYRIDGSEWITYDQPFNVTGEGEHTVEYRSIDQAGNRENRGNRSFRIDSRAPSTNATTAPEEPDTGWFQDSSVEVTLNASDPIPGSEVNYTQFRIDGEEWQTYNASFTVAGTGEHLVEYRTLDVAGNEESTQALHIDIDPDPPSTSSNIATPGGNNDWHITPPTVNLTCSDSGLSGCADTFYTIDESERKPYAGEFEIGENGAHTLTFWSEDRAGNGEVVNGDNIADVKVDLETPQSSLTVNGTLGNHGWYTSNVTANVTAQDDVSGVHEIFYRLDNETAWTDYTGNLTVGHGTHNLSAYATDAAGNDERNGSEGSVNQTIRIDTKPPEAKARGQHLASVTITNPVTGERRKVDVELPVLLASGTSSTANASLRDSGSGLDRARFLLDGTEVCSMNLGAEDSARRGPSELEVQCQWNTSRIEPGLHVGRWAVADVAGNTDNGTSDEIENGNTDWSAKVLVVVAHTNGSGALDAASLVDEGRPLSILTDSAGIALPRWPQPGEGGAHVVGFRFRP